MQTAFCLSYTLDIASIAEGLASYCYYVQDTLTDMSFSPIGRTVEGVKETFIHGVRAVRKGQLEIVIMGVLYSTTYFH